ncbi:phosphoglucosamine mutase [Brachybacterium huguangmaarense]|uniref:Phosphoglucosamine mutase n=1 Tax=Brachybacterium huguangmaarense TaxID=1652028 RepID=A0ABY6G170_9MICO|nr:phosphoglucosamine mutase [Brachybacterium huguangmaarense]UYG16943.1 phosphoglucosamine mutase [Brachybacterium huguangmaarense]
MARLFGTDGVRGRANVDITAELAVELSVAAAHVLATLGAFDGARPRAIIARDTRPSGDFLAAAVSAGLASAGVDVEDAGVLATPGLAYLVQSSGADLGVMLSASHNPAADNGIKFFARGGTKLPDEVEDAVEARMHEQWDRPQGDRVGTIRPYPHAVDQYVGHLVQTLSRPLDGLTVVADCANGAAYESGPAALRAAGATVHVIGDRTDGKLINEDCGSTHLEGLQEAVVRLGADAGVAFDGDADRCLAVDADGSVVDGDQIMGILALALDERGELPDHTLVATVMSNLGLRIAMRKAGIALVQTAVGDRYVLEEMRRGNHPLGGEQSGHVVMSRHATTGDGELTALHLLQRMAETGSTLAELAAVVDRLPQVMVNVKGVDKTRAGIDHGVLQAVAEAEQELGDTGRVLLRPSGTEPVVRVMVEAATLGQAQTITDRLSEIVAERLAL